VAPVFQPGHARLEPLNPYRHDLRVLELLSLFRHDLINQSGLALRLLMHRRAQLAQSVPELLNLFRRAQLAQSVPELLNLFRRARRVQSVPELLNLFRHDLISQSGLALR
jgi:hypothetical protein